MFERPRRISWRAIIALTFVSFGHAHASDATQTLSETRTDRSSSNATEASSHTHARKMITAIYGSDGTGVIEEIVVVGNKKRRRANSDRSSIAGPVIENSSRYDWQRLPI